MWQEQAKEAVNLLHLGMDKICLGQDGQVTFQDAHPKDLDGPFQPWHKTRSFAKEQDHL